MTLHRKRPVAKATKKRLSKKEHRADALAPEADEGRDKLRKAAGRSKYPLIRRYPNGETQPREARLPYAESIGIQAGTRGTETSKYPEEKKENSIP